MSSPSSPASTKPAPYINNLTAEQHEIVEEDYKAHLVGNLEALLIGTPTPNTTWPTQIKTVLADTLIRGRFKYQDNHTRILRVSHNSTLTLGTRSSTEPLPRNSQQQKKAAVLEDALCTALQILINTHAFNAQPVQLVQLRSAAAEFSFIASENVPSSLGVVSDIIRDVAVHSVRPANETLDLLVTVILGVPCVVEDDDSLGAVNHDRDVLQLLHKIIFLVAGHLLQGSEFKSAEPGRCWKATHSAKIAFLHRVSRDRYRVSANANMIRTLSKIDLAHALLETGVAFKAAGKKICYVAPLSLIMCVTNAVAGVYPTEAEALYDEHENMLDLHFLAEEDFRTMQETECDPKYGRWISMSSYFTRATLADFISRDSSSWSRVAANKRGDVMFFVARFGPWMLSTGLTVDAETITELLRKTVHDYPDAAPKARCFPKKKASVRVQVEGPVPPVVLEGPVPLNSDLDKRLLHSRFHPCTYKPTTLDAIINKPGRVLVKRHGVRGHGGRFIAAGILVLGVVAVVFNFANRDNWLEVAFDGAQVMSLVTGVAIAVVYLVNGTLTSTLDWLSGVTEVADEEQLARILGASIEEVKMACSYEKESLFWLSDVNSCFCPADKHGGMMFSEPLDTKIVSPHIKAGLVIGNTAGLWLLQGWAFRIENRGGIGHMVRVPHEDRVYVDDGKLRYFGFGTEHRRGC